MQKYLLQKLIKKIIFLYTSLCFFVSLSSAADLKVFIKGGNDNILGHVIYKKNDAGLAINIRANSGVILREWQDPAKSDRVSEGSDTIKEKAYDYELNDIANGERIQIRIIYSYEKKAYTYPLVLKLDSQQSLRSLDTLDKQISKTQYFVQNSTLDEAEKIFKDLPHSFQNIITYSESYSEKSLNYFNQESSSITAKLIDRKNQWNSFQKRIYDHYGTDYQGREENVKRQIEEKIKNLEVFDEFSYKLKMEGGQILSGGRFTPIASYRIPPVIRSEENSELKKEIDQEIKVFNERLFKSVFLPKFHSSFLNKEISFNGKDKDQIQTLKLYKNSFDQKRNLTEKNDRYHEITFAQNLIEIKQDKIHSWDKQILNQYENVSKSIIENNIDHFVSAINTLSNYADFQKGLAASLINNLNPASIVYPIEVECQSQWCEAGSLLGDAASLTLAAVEIGKGITLFLGGTGGTFLSVGLAPETGGASLLAAPATISSAVAGLALAAHGASIFHQTLGNMYEKISDYKNLEIFRSGKFLLDDLKSIGIDKIQDIRGFFKTDKWKILNEIRNTGKIKTSDGFKFFNTADKIANDFPDNKLFARVVKRSEVKDIINGTADFNTIEYKLDGSIKQNETFITAADDILHYSGADDLAKKISLYNDKEGTILKSLEEYVVMEFKFTDPYMKTIRSPIDALEKKRDYGFVSGGRTLGGIREWLIDSDSIKKDFIDKNSISIKEIIK